MKRNNLFDGESYQAMFAIIIYKWLLTHGENGAYPPTKSGSIHPLLS